MVRFVFWLYFKSEKMKKEELRQYAALLLLVILIKEVTNPAKAAVMWADELVKELYGDKTESDSGD